MRVPVVLLFTVVVIGVVEGVLVSKCDLKRKLTEAANQPMKDKGMANIIVVAKGVCHVEKTSGFNTSAVTKMTPTIVSGQNTSGGAGDVWTLYGIFQLSNHLVCNDGEGSSPNICMLDCKELIDDDISDDIECLQKIYTKLLEEYFLGEHHEALKEMMMQLFQSDCTMVNPDEYFSEC